MIRFRSPLILVLLSALLLACGRGEPSNAPEIGVEETWVRAMPLMREEGGSPTNSAAYAVIRNRGDTPDRLVGAEMDSAGRVEIHESLLVDDVMRMRKLDGIEIPSHTSVELAPGGVHLMLMGLSRPLVEGEEIDLVLRFERSGELALTVPVRSDAGR